MSDNRILEGVLEQTRAERDRLRAEVEDARMKLAACSVAAIQNTPASAKDRLPLGHPYYNGAYKDVCDAVDREMP